MEKTLTGEGKVISATYSIFGENEGDLIADEVEYWGEVAGMTAAEAAEKVAGDVLDTCGGDHDNYLADAGIEVKAECPTIYTTAEDDRLPAGHELRSYHFCGRNYGAEILVDVLVEVYPEDLARKVMDAAGVVGLTPAKAEERDLLSVNVGRDGRGYLWYLDTDGREACADIATGELIPVEKTEELFS